MSQGWSHTTEADDDDDDDDDDNDGESDENKGIRDVWEGNLWTQLSCGANNDNDERK